MPVPEFVALADLLRAEAVPSRRPSTVTAEAPQTLQAEHRDDAPAVREHPDDVVAAIRDARLFRARLADAFDDALVWLLRELAADVLARELRLAPCDVAAIARRARECAPIVRLRVAPADVARGEYGLPVVPDPALHAGDAVFELDGGAFDARLGVRLAAVLDIVAR